MEQMSIAFETIGEADTVQLISDMWRCIQVSPMAPPALKESIRKRLLRLGLGE